MPAPTPIHVVLGTAGHIDHGKTTLVRRLTGVDTDRLPEEKRRGITIELGFAPFDLPSGARVGVVDVPGHERFVKNMVAGAGGIDLVMLVVAADEAVMPQTREHLEICQLLGVRRGLVALTKIDRAGPELAALAEDDVRTALEGTFLQSAVVVPCSAVTGDGIDRLVAEIEALVKQHRGRETSGAAVLPIDRVFSVKGFGSVVTGTLLSGSLGVGDLVEVLPAVPGRALDGPARVRSAEVFHAKVERAFAGDRTALSLQGVELDQLARGQLVLTPGAARPTRLIDARVLHLGSRAKPLKTGARALLHVGTTIVETGITLLDADRLEPGASGWARLRLSTPVAVLAGQRFILRGFETPTTAGRTIGGGLILDPEPGKRRRHAPATIAVLSRLDALMRPEWERPHREEDEVRRTKSVGGQDVREPDAAEPARTPEQRLDEALVALVRERGPRGLELATIARRLARPAPQVEKAAARAAKNGAVVVIEDLAVDADAVRALGERVLGIIDAFHREHTFRGGMALVEIATRVGRAVPAKVTERAARSLVGMKKLAVDPEGFKRPDHKPFAAAGGDARARIQKVYDDALLEPPTVEELEKSAGLDPKALRELIAAMVRSGDLVRAAPSLYFSKKAFAKAEADLLGHIAAKGELSTADAKAITGISRKFLIPLLEAMDKAGTTVRVGEVRKARR